MIELTELWAERWPSFNPKELLSDDAMTLFESNYMPMQIHFLDHLQAFRRIIDKPFLINHAGMKRRGFRSWLENKQAGGAAGSWHPRGCAADVTIPGLTPLEVAQKAINYGFKGVGIYDSFTHLDMRLGQNAVWDLRTDT